MPKNKEELGGRPKKARPLKVVKFTGPEWAMVVRGCEKLGIKQNGLASALKEQLAWAEVQSKAALRRCAHQLLISRQGRPLQNACSLCEARKQSGKTML